MRNPVITGNTAVAEGDALNLTCRVESFPPSRITWTRQNLNNEPKTDLQNNNGSATLFIPYVTAEHCGPYICRVQHPDTAVTIFAGVTVTCE